MNNTHLSSLRDAVSARVSTPVAVWLAAVAGLAVIMGAGIASLDSNAAPASAQSSTFRKPVVKDPFGCAELKFLKEEPACSQRSRDDLPRHGGPSV